MDVETVRERAEAFCDALVAGDVGRATEEMSKGSSATWARSWRSCRLPSEATVRSVDRGSGYNVVIGSSARPKSRSRLAGRTATADQRSSKPAT